MNSVSTACKPLPPSIGASVDSRPSTATAASNSAAGKSSHRRPTISEMSFTVKVSGSNGAHSNAHTHVRCQCAIVMGVYLHLTSRRTWCHNWLQCMKHMSHERLAVQDRGVHVLEGSSDDVRPVYDAVMSMFTCQRRHHEQSTCTFTPVEV